MSRTEMTKAVAAEERMEEARSFVRRVRTAIRRKYTAEEKIPIVLEGSRTRSLTVTCAGGRGSSLTPATRGPRNLWRRARSESPVTL